ncbi:OmpA family protein [Janthinobacterium sp. 17J80-10]|uniref:OmpA family protein n=1 Tax=Janthinobacterium sp. 17J80-10 TaxID=2497863 RepID=UPI0013E8F136|nr:OmpA family protein [Janthinobacterium sp. 17J80-10]
MTANLLSLVQQALGGDFSNLAGQFLGESPGATQSALSSLLPAVLGVITRKGATPDGASGLISLLNGANLDTSALANPAGLFGAGGAGINNLLKAGTGSLVPALFGDKSTAVANTLASSSGIKTTSAASLIAMAVPLVMTVLKKFIGENGLNASSLASLLAGQVPHLQGAIDNRMAGALGFASPSAFLGGLGGKAAAASGAASSAATAATVATKSGLSRWLPWLIGAAVLLFLWNMFSGKPTHTSAPTPASAAISMPAKVYFAVGSAAVDADGSKTIAAVADMIKRDKLKVAITGYTDKSGDVARNEELAKSRAKAVKDALIAAGAAEADVGMQPPSFVETGAGGNDAEARRVEINRQ